MVKIWLGIGKNDLQMFGLLADAGIVCMGVHVYTGQRVENPWHYSAIIYKQYSLLPIEGH